MVLIGYMSKNQWQTYGTFCPTHTCMPYRFLTEARSAIDTGGVQPGGMQAQLSIMGRQKNSPKSDAVEQIKQKGHHMAKQPGEK